MTNEVGQPTFVEIVTVKPKVGVSNGSGQKSCPPFTLVHLPDTHNYTSTYPKIFRRQTSWVISQFSRRNIRAVLHTGDMVENGAEGSDENAAEWVNANDAMDRLDGYVPYFVSIGENDYDTVGGGSNFSSDKWQEHFGADRFLETEYFGGSSPNGESTFGFFTASRRTWMVLNLELDIIDESLDWAKDIVNQYRLPTIVQTHRWLDPQKSGNKRRTDTIIKTGPIVGNSPQEVWDELIAPNDQIFMVISGHFNGQTRQVSVNNNNKRVFEIQANFEDEIAEEDQDRVIGALALSDPLYYLSSYSISNWQNYPKIIKTSQSSATPLQVYATNTSSSLNIKVDKNNSKMYWSGWSIGLGNPWGQGYIMRANLDGSAAAKWLNENIEITAIALDLKNNYLYYGTRGYYQTPTGPNGTGPFLNVQATIKRARLNSPFQEVIAQFPIFRYQLELESKISSYPSSIAIDLVNDTLWYTDPVKYEIGRMSLSGQNRTTIISLNKSTIPYHIAIDPVWGKIFYTSNQGVHRADFDGSNNGLLISDPIASTSKPYYANVMDGYQTDAQNVTKAFFRNFLTYDQDTNTLFWNGIDYSGSTITGRSIRKASAVFPIKSIVVSEPLGFCGLDVGSSYVAPVDGGDEDECVNEPDNTKIYVTETNLDPDYGARIRLVDVEDPSPFSAPLQNAIAQTIFIHGRPIDVKVDLTNGYIYWADQLNPNSLAGDGRIVRSHLDGSNMVTLADGIPTPLGLYIDYQNGHIYVCGASSVVASATLPQYINRYDLNGTNKVVLYTGGSLSINSILVDEANELIYFTQGGIIYRMGIDGSGVTAIWSAPFISAVMSIAWNKSRTVMYWSDYQGTTADTAANAIWKSPISDSFTLPNPEKIISANSVSSWLLVDDAANKLYWADASLQKLYSANLSNYNTTELLTFVSSPHGLCFGEQVCQEIGGEIPTPPSQNIPGFPDGDVTIGPIDWLGGAGFLRYIEFYESSGTIEVKTYTPYYRFSLVDSDNRFTLSMDFESRLGDLGKTPCDSAISMDVQRDLYDPKRISTVKQAAAIANINPDNYQPYFRDFNSKKLTATTYSATVSSKASIVFVLKTMLVNPMGCDRDRFPVLDRISSRLSAQEILPSRFIW